MKTLLFCFAGLATALLVQANSFPASEKFSQTYPVSATAEFALANVNGSVEITAWDKNEIFVEAEKRAGSAEDLPKIQIEVDATTNRVSISTKYERTGWFGRTVQGTVSYKVHVPATVNLRKIDVVNSNINIFDVEGEIDARSVNGSIHATGLCRNAHFRTVNGNIEASLAATEKNPNIQAKTVNGSFKLALPDSAAASVEASTVNGSVKSDFPVAAIKASRTKLEGQIGSGKGAEIEAHSVNGNISFRRQS